MEKTKIDTDGEHAGKLPTDDQDETNSTILQGFEWYCPRDQKHWQRLKKAVPALAALGITSLWIPPATKESSPYGNGYGIYDLWDLGEFNQKDSVATKWGTKADLVDLAEYADAHGIAILFDAVLNHKAAADYTEEVLACKVDPEDRTIDIGDPQYIEAWTGFNFEGRAGKYSSMRWNKAHFTGVDVDNKSKSHAIWRFSGKEWAREVDNEFGNFDYLMFSDIDHTHPEVREDIFNWIKWLSTQVKLGGLRLDAVRHFSAKFLLDLVRYIAENIDSKWFFVGEYWRDNAEVLARYIEYMEHRISLVDVSLLSNFSRLSLQENADLRTVFEKSLVSLKPRNAVTFVNNHDTQKGRTIETPIAPFFIPIAYALILLKKNAGLPCVFYADLYGSLNEEFPGHYSPPGYGGNAIPKLILMRRMYAYGEETSYMDDPSCIGFTRSGASSQSAGAGLAVIINNSWEVREKKMFVGEPHATEHWTDVLRWCGGEVIIDSRGCATFHVSPRSVSVWVSKDALGRKELDEFVFDWNIYNLSEEASSVHEGEKSPSKSGVKDTVPAWLQPDVEGERLAEEIERIL